MAHRFFKDRASVEQDPSLKQIIPYVVLTHGDLIFTMRRLHTQTESRLHNLVSVGIGGHINPCDGQGEDVLKRAMLRELQEEVVYPWEPKASLAGFLNDDTTDVGSVHFGLVYRVESPVVHIEVREREKMSGEFLPFLYVQSLADEMESWSRFAVKSQDFFVYAR